MSNQIVLTSTSITAFNLTGSVATITFQYATSQNGTYLDLPNPYNPTAVYTILPAGATYYSISSPLTVGYWYQYVTRNAAGTVLNTVNKPFTLADKNAGYSVVVSNFAQPAVNATVSVTVSNTAWVTAGSTVYIPNGGYYDVMSVDSSASLTLLNTGMQENAVSATSIAAGSVVSPSGLAVKPYTPTTATTANYSQPVSGSNVQISVGRTSIFAVGNSIYIGGSSVRGGIYTIQSIDSPTLLTVQRVSSGNNIATSGTIPSGTSVVYYPATAMPMYVLSSQLFGSGLDGDLLITSGTTFSNPLSERYYRNVAWESGANTVFPLTYTRLYVAGVLDLTNCPANGIRPYTANSPNASGTTGASALTLGSSNGLVGFPQNSGAGGNGGTGVGSAGSTVSTPLQTTPCGGTGAAGAGGVGGASGVNVGGAGGGAAVGQAVPPNASSGVNLPSRYVDMLLMGGGAGMSKMTSGSSGSGGGGGGGDGAAGGGGGAGGSSGGVIMIFANTIIRPDTQRVCINANGLTGGNGFSPTTGTNVGGGGGGAGGAGGIVYIYYHNILGTANNLQVTAHGGNGGNGGTGRGAGSGGGGGGSGDSGVIMMINGATGALTQRLTVTAGGGPTSAPSSGTVAGATGNTSAGQNLLSI